MDTKLLQLAALLGQGAQSVAPPGTAQAQGGKAIQESAGSAIQANIEKEAEKKKSKGWGSIGGVLGGLLGTLAAPATGGASLALAGGLGAAGGNAIGQYADTGVVDPMQVGMAGVQGAAPAVLNGISNKVAEVAAPAPVAPTPAPQSGTAASAIPVDVRNGTVAAPTGPQAPVVPNQTMPNGGPTGPSTPSAYSKAGMASKLGGYMNGTQLLQTLQGGSPFNSSQVTGPRRYKYDENGNLVGAQ